jgi:hypothetical protein
MIGDDGAVIGLDRIKPFAGTGGERDKEDQAGTGDRSQKVARLI